MKDSDLLIGLQRGDYATNLVECPKEALEGVSVARLQPTVSLAAFDLDGTTAVGLCAIKAWL